MHRKCTACIVIPYFSFNGDGWLTCPRLSLTSPTPSFDGYENETRARSICRTVLGLHKQHAAQFIRRWSAFRQRCGDGTYILKTWRSARQLVLHIQRASRPHVSETWPRTRSKQACLLACLLYLKAVSVNAMAYKHSLCLLVRGTCCRLHVSCSVFTRRRELFQKVQFKQLEMTPATAYI